MDFVWESVVDFVQGFVGHFIQGMDFIQGCVIHGFCSRVETHSRDWPY